LRIAAAPETLTIEARRVIRAAPEHVFSFLAHPEHLPRYAAPLWMAADPVERRGGAHIVTLRGYFIGLPVESVQRVIVCAPSSVERAQVRGTLRMLAARCTVRPVDGGTEVLYHLEVDLGIPMIPDDAARQFLVQHLERMLDRIKLAAERKTPARSQGRPRRRVGAAAGDAASPEPEEVEEDEADALPVAPAAEVALVPAARDTDAPGDRPDARRPSLNGGAAAEGQHAAMAAIPSNARIAERPEESSSQPRATETSGPDTPPGRAHRRRRRRRRRTGGPAPRPAS
jgi:hypothetical protein